MSTKWTQTDQTITVEQNSELLLRLFAIGFLIGGGYFAYYLVLGTYDYVTGFLRGEPGLLQDFVTSIPGFLITIIMMLAFGIPGVLMFFGRKRVAIDRGAGIITEITDYGIFKRQQQHATTEFQTVEVAFAKDTSNKTRTTLFDVTLKGRRGKSVLVAVVDAKEVSQALELANQVAALLDIKIHEDIGGWSPTTPRSSAGEPAKTESLPEKIFALVVFDFIGVPDWRRRRKSSLPDVMLGHVMWKFAGAEYSSRVSFDRAVRKYQTDQKEDPDDWEPDKVAIAVSRVAIQYECQEANGDWVKPIIELTAGDGKCITNGELLYNLHNAVIEKLRGMDKNNFQGLELGEPAREKPVPLYGMNLEE